MNLYDVGVLQAVHLAILASDESTAGQVDAVAAQMEPTVVIAGLLAVLGILGEQSYGAEYGRWLRAVGAQIEAAVLVNGAAEDLPEAP